MIERRGISYRVVVRYGKRSFLSGLKMRHHFLLSDQSHGGLVQNLVYSRQGEGTEEGTRDRKKERMEK